MNRGRLVFVFIILLAVVCLPPVKGQTGNKQYNSYKGLVMAGYQGWFATPDDGAGRGFYHYEGRDGFKPGSTNVDMWPDVSEYEKVYPTPFKYEDGSTAYVFSSQDESSVDTHFRWMKEYGLDGVFMQRFVAEIMREKGKPQFNKVLSSAIKSAAKHNRAIGIMYDLSGMSVDGAKVLLKDIDELTKLYDLMEREKAPTYLFHNGKPLVTVWGVGFNDGREYGLKEARVIVDGLKKRGFSIMLGVPTHWREQKHDTVKDKEFHALIKDCDVIMPWFVGRYNEQDYESFKKQIPLDMVWAKQNGVDYAPLCYPGFSWRNMHGERGANTFNVPRNKGNFFWKQIASCIGYGAEMLYIAMFDEIDEGTAIFKCATKVPVGKSTFVPIEEGIHNDHYLWLVGKGRDMLRGTLPFTKEQPVR